MTFAERPLWTVALGGHAIAPGGSGLDYATESNSVAAAAREIAELAAGRYRLLVVHGNGPQVGRLLGSEGDIANLAVHVAQTQGELGYLLGSALENALGEPVASLVTRTEVDTGDPAFADPQKPIGPVLEDPPPGPAAPQPGGRGWRRLVPSPQPLAVLELPQIRRLLQSAHVVAGGGGGVPVCRGAGVAAVVDKDPVAARLALALDAAGLLFATDVAGIYDNFGGARPRLIRRLAVAEARARLAAGAFAAGSMAPKVDSAVCFAAATGRPARVAGLGELQAALRDGAGTRIG